MLAAIGGGTFLDLTRRGFSEGHTGVGDPTDVALSVAFALILFAAASDLRQVGVLGEIGAPALQALGGVAIAAGVWLRFRAERSLGENFLVRLAVRKGHTLIRSGPFRWIRHPNYSALLLIALGSSAALASPRAALATLGLWLPVALVRISREERILARAFGREWEDYRAATWRLIPGIL